MFKKVCFCLLTILLPILVYTSQNTSFSPNAALYNDNILNIPPLKIEGFLLGMIKDNFEKLLKKKFNESNIKKIFLKKSEPTLTVYNIDTQSTEHFIFYVYGNLLGKIKIINMRPFEEPEVIIKRYIDRYNTPDDVWEYKTEQYSHQGFYWKRYTWKKYYQYTPQFSSRKLDMLINITVHINMKHRFVQKAVYGYNYDDEFLKLHFGTRFDW